MTRRPVLLVLLLSMAMCAAARDLAAVQETAAVQQLAAVPQAAAADEPAAVQQPAAWEARRLTDAFLAEGAAAGDLDGDGHVELVAGTSVWLGPDFARRVALGPVTEVDPLEYSAHFLSWIEDIDRDGRPDVLTVGFPGRATHWLRNPGGVLGEREWTRHVVHPAVCNESPVFADLDGDGRRELVAFADGRAVWMAPGDDPAAPWELHPVSESLWDRHTPFEHGLGVGDLDGDGRPDVLDRHGWWRQPVDLATAETWERHPWDLAAGRRGGAQMLVTDVDGDGDADVVTSLDAHGWGLSWFEQLERVDRTIPFREHRLMDARPEDNAHGLAVSQLHALALADVDRDGVDDVVTGKRWWAHGPSGDPGSGAPALLLWFRVVRDPDGARLVPRVIDADTGVGTQVTVADVDVDGRPDVLVANKKGVTLLRQVDALAAAPPRAPPPPAPVGLQPRGRDGLPLDLGFESGDLAGWTAAGEAFAGQPVQGDTVSARGREPSRHQGRHWVGGYELLGDDPHGTLSSDAFLAEQPWASFLIGGGAWAETRVELVRAEDGEVVHRAVGGNSETMQRVVVDLRELQGAWLRVRVVDERSGHWGHVNFDDLRLHAERPTFERPEGAPELFVPDPVVHRGLAATEAAAAMTVPDGYRVELVAGEPDVHQPVALAIDVRNRIWVVEAHTYPRRAPDGEGRDRVLVFSDEDGDGTHETRTVFMEGLNLVSGIAVGHGGVWLGAAPWLLFVPDRDHDLVPDGAPEVLLDGWGFQDTHETLNAFTWGPDGWLYGCHGVFTHSRVGAPGTPDDERVPINAGVWRYHPVRREFEVFARGTSNPWGVDFDARGEAFITACVIPHLYHVVPGARYLRQAGTHFDSDVYEDVGTIADHRHWVGATPHGGNLRSDSAGGGHAHCGALVYQGGLFPDDVAGAVLMFNIHGNRVNRDHLEPSGSSFVGRHGEDLLLANDTWFRGIALEEAPDGSVVFTDWSDERACHGTDPEVWDRGNGRVYRLTHGDPRPWSGDLRARDDLGLVALHRHGNRWFADQARLVLSERWAAGTLSPAAWAGLRELLADDDPLLRLRALWTLHATGADLDPVRRLDDPDGSVRGWTIRLATERGEASPAFLARLRELARRDPSPVVRRELASRLERLGPDALDWELLAALASRAEDRDDELIPLLLWYALKGAVAGQPERALELAAATPLSRLARLVARRVAELGPDGHAALVRAVAAVDDARAAPLLEGWVAGLPPTGTATAPPGWSELVARLSASEVEAVRAAGERLARYHPRHGANHGHWSDTVGEAARPLEQRRAVLASLEAGPDDVAALEALIRTEPALRAAAFDALARGGLARVEQLLPHWDGLAADERLAAVSALASRPATAAPLLDAVAAGSIDRGELSAATLRALRTLDDAAVDERLDALYGSLRDARPDAAETIARWTARLTDGSLGTPDLPAGREVFARTCGRCHVLFDAGGDVGPGLTGSHRRDLGYLLENVVDPSAVLGRDQMATHVFLRDGRLVTGLLRTETPSTLTLATETGDVTIAREDVDERRLSAVSMMPEGLLDGLSDEEVRDLVAYLRADAQVPRRAVPADVERFFDGETLAGWRGDPALWSVEDGEIVGRTDGLAHNAFLRSELDLRDFRLTCEVLLVEDRGNAGIQFRSRELAGGDVAGLQADIGPGWWGKLYDEHGRGLLVADGAGDAVRRGDWNRYEITATGAHVRTTLNGHPCVDLVDEQAARHGIVAFQLHSGGPTELRIRDLRLVLDP